MSETYSLLLRKSGTLDVVNSYRRWGIVCSKVPFKVGGKVKTVAVRDWKDEHGEDAFLPSKLMLQAYDAQFELAYKGEELAKDAFNLSLAFSRIDAFKKWLTGNDTSAGSGSSLTIYSPYAGIGRMGYVSEISDEEPYVCVKQAKGNVYCENVVTFKLTFRVTDPMTNVVLEEIVATDE